MGLSSVTNRVAFAGDGSSTVFSFPYYFFSPSDFSVYLFNTTTGLSVPQVLSTNFTVSGNVNSQGVYPFGGNVVMASAVPVGTEIVITRSPSQVQNYALLQNGNINSLALVQQFDYLTALVQRLQDEVSRCIQIPDGLGPVGGSSFSTVLPSTIAIPGTSGGLALIVNSGATGIALGSSASGGGGGGTVTSVDMSVPAFMTIAGNPITNAGVLSLGLSGIALPVTAGGTGLNTPLVQGQVVFAASPTVQGQSVGGTVGQVLTYQGSSAPSWVTVSASGSTDLTSQVRNILPEANGGTGVAGLTPQFGLIWASSATQLGVIPSSTSGLFLQANGSSAPSWASVATGSTNLATNVIGTLPVANGGTGQNQPLVQGQILFGSTTLSAGMTTGGTVGQVLSYQGSAAPIWATVTTGSVSLVNGVSGILPIANGGTGNPALSGSTMSFATSITGVSDGTATIGTAANSNGFRFNAAYLTTDFQVGPNSSQGNDFIEVGRTIAPGPNPGIKFGSNTQGYGIYNAGSEFRTYNFGANQTIFVIADHWFGVRDTTLLKNYLVASTSNTTNLANLTVGISGSGGYYGQLSLGTAQSGGGNINIANSSSTAGYTVYLPGAQGGAVTTLLNDGSGNLSWQVITNSSVPLSVATKTANYNAVGTDNVIIAGSGCGQVNLFGAVGNTGRVLTVKKTGTAPNDPVVIAGSNATIDGTSFMLTAQYDSINMVCDGANWQVLDQKNTTAVQSCNPNILGFGVIGSSSFQCQKMGSFYKINGTFNFTTPTSSTAQIAMVFANTSVISSTIAPFTKVGSFMYGSSTTAAGQQTPPTLFAQPSNGNLFFSVNGAGISGLQTWTGTQVVGNGLNSITLEAFVPILNWM